MADSAPSDGLNLDSDLELQERVWRMERVGWVVTAVLLGAAMLGAFGGTGLLSRGHQTEGDDLSVDFPRLARHSTETSFSFVLRPTGPEAELWIDNSFFQHAALERVVPEPEAMVRDTERTYFRFPAIAPHAPFPIDVSAMPMGYGPLVFNAGSTNGPSTRLVLFVFP